MGDFRYWPSPGAAPQPPVERTATPKLASNELGDVVLRAAGLIASWRVPAGLEKVAELRPGGDENVGVPNKDTIWSHPNAHPAVLLILLLDRYGQDLFEWDPEVILATLKKDGVNLSNPTKTKILASRVPVNSPSPWRQWEVLHWVALGLAGEPPNFIYAEDPEIGHLVSAYDYMQLVDPDRDTSDEVDKFIAAVFKEEGITYIPEPLSFAQHELEDPKIRCNSCGAIHRDDGDVTCVTCGSKDLVRVPYEHADLRDKTKSLWDKVKNMPLEQAVDLVPEDTPEGNAVYQLLVHWDYAHVQRALLGGQLRSLSTK